MHRGHGLRIVAALRCQLHRWRCARSGAQPAYRGANRWADTLISHCKVDPQQAGGLVTLFLVGAVVASLFFAPRFNRNSGRPAVPLALSVPDAEAAGSLAWRASGQKLPGAVGQV